MELYSALPREKLQLSFPLMPVPRHKAQRYVENTRMLSFAGICFLDTYHTLQFTSEKVKVLNSRGYLPWFDVCI